jgi:hypothetical protein
MFEEAYFCMIFRVSWSVLNEFISSNGTLTLFSEFSPYRNCRTSCTSICRTVRSRKLDPSRTSMADLGPTQPMVVPSPPFSLSTASFERSCDASLAFSREAYGLI